MELLFFWMQDFRKFKEQGFNFSSELVFNVRPPKDADTNWYDIEISLNRSYQNIFPSQISNVTGIVGKNGSGKSSLMHCLKLMYGQLHRLTSPLIFSMLDQKTNTIHTYFYQKGGVEEMRSMPVNQIANPDVHSKFNLAHARPYNINRMNFDKKGHVSGLHFNFEKEITCAYLTNGLDSHNEVIYEGILNQSTTHRLEQYFNIYIKAKEREAIRNVDKPSESIIEIYPSHLKDYHRRELRSNVRFIQYANANNLKSVLPDLPTSISITFNFEDYQYLLEPNENSRQTVELDKLQSFHKKAGDSLYLNTNKIAAFQNLLYLCTFYYSIRYDLFRANNYRGRDLSGTIQNLLDKKDDFFDELKKVMDHIMVVSGGTSKERRIKEILGENLKMALEHATIEDRPNHKEDPTFFSFYIDEKLWNLLSLIFEFKHGDDTTFMDYQLGSGFSSGEEALINHFSRLYEIKKSTKTKSLLLLIDEVELYSHPQWQKNYISRIIPAIQCIFTGINVQIVLSTHSPFVVSDLPKQNLIFLKKDSSGLCINSNIEIQTETFAANIHELFTNSFFLSDGLMGEYSRLYIEELIQEIKSKRKITKSIFNNNFKNRIGIIGEQFLKTKILELIATKADSDLVDSIIEERADELDMLRLIRKQKP
jgi:hypothetical protein